MLSDVHLIDKLAHFDRERIPERVVHAKGAGAHGYFEVSVDQSPHRRRLITLCCRPTGMCVWCGMSATSQVTHDVTPYCKAKFLSAVGKRTPVFLRFSTGAYVCDVHGCVCVSVCLC